MLQRSGVPHPLAGGEAGNWLEPCGGQSDPASYAAAMWETARVPVFRLDVRRVPMVVNGEGAARGDLSGPEDR
jgi:hypothetical protein